ncbi:MAG: acyltransferase family protein [Roseobacter sp.]
MTFGDALRSERSQNLNVLRLLLAMAVIVSHAWPLALGADALEPLEQLTGRSLGGWAVGIFFFISGVLITASAERKTAWPFWAARARRIIPGLGVALLVTLALAMASGSSAGLGQSASWFLRALTLVSIEHRLPEAFAGNPLPEVVNGPLWSLLHEVIAYAVCAVFVWAGGARRRKAVVALVILAGAMSLVQGFLPTRLATFAPLFAAFSLGMAAYIWRDRLVLRSVAVFLVWPLALLVPAPLALGLVSFGIVALALSVPGIALKSDASYGLYIYGWPVAQMIVALQPGVGPMQLAMLSVLATYPIALLSWHFVEQPSLAKRWVQV